MNRSWLNGKVTKSCKCGKRLAGKGSPKHCRSCAQKQYINKVCSCGNNFDVQVCRVKRVDKCKECRTKKNNETKRRRYQSYIKWYIVFDPATIEEGGFSKGALFTQADINCMLQVNSFTPGTILKKRYTRWKVGIKDNGKQRLVRL
jgi:hypothetical protein